MHPLHQLVLLDPWVLLHPVFLLPQPVRFLPHRVCQQVQQGRLFQSPPLVRVDRQCRECQLIPSLPDHLLDLAVQKLQSCQVVQ